VSEIKEISLRDSLPVRIETARLELELPSMADLAELVPLANNDNVTRWTARMPYPYGQNDGARFIAQARRMEDERDYSIRNEDGAFVGVISLMFYDDRPAELGYWLGEPFWGRGYGTEAVEALLAAARASGRFDVLAARAMAGNTASLRILERAGFLRISEEIGDCGRNKGQPIVYLQLEVAR